MFPTEKVAGTKKIEKHRPIMLTEACREACTGILIKRVQNVWDAHKSICSCNTGFARNVSTVEPIMKLRMCIDHALRRGKPLFLNGEDLSKAFDSPERAIKDIALRRLGVPESVVDFLVSLDEGNEVQIITKYGVTYDTPGLEKGFEAQCGVKQGTPEGPFVWLAVSDIVWTEVERISTEAHQYEARKGPQISVPLLAFVGGGIYLNRSHEGRQFVLNVASMLYSLLGLERNGEKCFAVELDPEWDRTKRPPKQEPPYISTWVGWDNIWGNDGRPHRRGWGAHASWHNSGALRGGRGRTRIPPGDLRDRVHRSRVPREHPTL